jgi:hypothetical protein
LRIFVRNFLYPRFGAVVLGEYEVRPRGFRGSPFQLRTTLADASDFENIITTDSPGLFI